MRTIIDLPDEQLRALDTVRRRLGISRAEAVRRALRLYLAEASESEHEAGRDPAFGLWADYPEDPMIEVRRRRELWDEQVDALRVGPRPQ